MRPDQQHLVIFARAPRLGTVKRRLAKGIGALAALRFHRNTTAALLKEVARDPRWTTWLAVTPDAWAARPGGLWPASAGRAFVIGQGGGDLGARMGRVFQELPPGPVVIVGSDIPGIRRRHVAQAFRALGSQAWVLGPAQDGGYWLIGAKRTPALRLPFEGVQWGGDEVSARTRGNMGAASVALLETLNDVDRAEDMAAQKFKTKWLPCSAGNEIVASRLR